MHYMKVTPRKMQQWCDSMESDQFASCRAKFIDKVPMLQIHTSKSSGCCIVGALAKMIDTRFDSPLSLAPPANLVTLS